MFFFLFCKAEEEEGRALSPPAPYLCLSLFLSFGYRQASNRISNSGQLKKAKGTTSKNAFRFFFLVKIYQKILSSSVVFVLVVRLRLLRLVVVVDLAQDASREGFEGAHVASIEPGDAAGGAPVVFFQVFFVKKRKSR